MLGKPQGKFLAVCEGRAVVLGVTQTARPKWTKCVGHGEDRGRLTPQGCILRVEQGDERSMLMTTCVGEFLLDWDGGVTLQTLLVAAVMAIEAALHNAGCWPVLV